MESTLVEAIVSMLWVGGMMVALGVAGKFVIWIMEKF